MFSIGQLIGLVMQIVFSLIIPIVLIIIWKKKTKASLKPFFLGMTCFFIFVIILENILHFFALRPDSFIRDNTIAYIFYGILAAGIFEETGRFIYFKIFNKIVDNKEDSVSFGIGHGGFECIFLLGLTSLSNFLLAITYNFGGIESITFAMPEEQALVVTDLINTLLEVPAYQFYIGIYERIIAIILHISLSILVFFAVKNSSKVYFYPIAIVLHALSDLPAILYQIGSINNIYLVEIITTILVLIIAIFAKKVYASINIENKEIEKAE